MDAIAAVDLESFVVCKAVLLTVEVLLLLSTAGEMVVEF